MAKGYKEYQRFKLGERLTHKQAILAQCYVCNGLDEGGEDCRGKSCPLYQFMPYRRNRQKAVMTERQKESLRKARATLKNAS
ncbi:MAG: hypothetical protein Q8P12_06230 [bacterium]|nr:hypothetical protein [bacterium]